MKQHPAIQQLDRHVRSLHPEDMLHVEILRDRLNEKLHYLDRPIEERQAEEEQNQQKNCLERERTEVEMTTIPPEVQEKLEDHIERILEASTPAMALTSEWMGEALQIENEKISITIRLK